MAIRAHGSGWSKFGTIAEALENQLWVQTWRDQNANIIRPGWSISAVALIPPEDIPPPDPNDPSAGGGTARSQVFYDFHMEAATQDELNPVFDQVHQQLAVNTIYDYSELVAE